MPRRKKSGFTRNHKVVPVTGGLDPADADGAANTGALVGVADEEYRLISVKGTWALRDLNPNDLLPVIVGVAHGDYTETEIEEALEAEASMSRGNKVANEQASRLVRRVGALGGAADSVLNDGRPIRTRLNWHIAEGETVNMFTYNATGTTIVSGIVRFDGQVFIRYGQ